MDDVFKALADPSRRALLDALFVQDGQSLGALQAMLPMTRFGVMKHLRVLEDAGLIVVRRRGREKRHHLNPVPIRLMHDRWVSKYTAAFVAGLSALKQDLEGKMERVFEIYIKTTPERLWQAITTPALRAKYNFGVVSSPDFSAGAPYTGHGGGKLIIEGETLVSEPPFRLVQTFRPLWDDAVKAEGQSRVTWDIRQVGDSCHLLVIHDQLREGANTQVYGGWPMVLSGLKTLLETGELLTTPGSLMYAPGDAW